MRKSFDYTLLLTTLLLVVIGLTMVFSASGVLAKERFQDSTFFLKKELFAALIGFTGLFLVRLIPLKFFSKMVWPLFFVSVLLLSLVLIPAFGSKVAGVSRWFRVGPFSFQPSEVAKLALIFFMAHILTKKKEKISLFVGFATPMVFSGLLIGLVLLGKDLGGATVMGATVFFMLFVGGARPSYLLSELLLALPAFYFLVFSIPYRRARVLAFMNPWEYPRGAGFQIIQSYVAFHAGGFFGQGLGDGKQKLFYLPEAHTDFIFSVIGEELGLFGTLTVLGLFAVWLCRALRIARNAPDLFSFYLALGISLMFGLQVLLNVAVVTGLLPTKGLPLPFISYGGSSLILSLLAVGILLNISSKGEV
ncbi:MAG: putative lipid II flippase FtsW [Deltaproteobacteria bacterium]|nr:putative lipid II flippase FtsW [Deltaproteobacteria bacterium]